MTIPVARLVGVRLHDHPMPQRFCYAGSVFRHAETQGGRQREFSQAGLELIGASSPAADAEVMALTMQAMRTAGLNHFRLVLGHLQYFDALLQDLQLTSEQTTQFQRAINRNSDAELDDFLRNTPLRTQQRHTVEQLPLLSGPNAQAVIAHADRLCLNYGMHKALTNLRDIYQVLDAYGEIEQVYLDLTEINNLGYYTGISFEVLSPGIGFPLGSGGRYDNLIGTFGAPQPAVGVALGIDRLLHAQRSTNADEIGGLVTPHILISSNNSADCLALVNEWRQGGLRVVVSVNENRGEELWLAAQQMGISLAASWTGQGFDVYGLNPDQPASAAFIPLTEASAILQHAQEVNAQKPPVITTRKQFGFSEKDNYSEEAYGPRS